MNLVVGQSVIVERTGNAARGRSGEDLYFPAVVKSIGRKWFVIESSVGWMDRERFSLEDGLCDGRGYISDYRVWVSKQEISDRDERIRLLVDIDRNSDGILRKMDLDRLRRVHEMIFGNGESN